MQNNNASTQHSLVLSGRSAATITGVEDVECFNDQIVVLRTPLGALTVSGTELNISQLILEEGRLVIEGEITSLEYAEPRRTSGRNFMGRIFG